MRMGLAITFCVLVAQNIHAQFHQVRLYGPGNSGWLLLSPRQEAAQVAAYNALERQEALQEAVLARSQEAQKEAEVARQQQIQKQLEELRKVAEQQASDVMSAEASLKTLIENILSRKKLIPVDPWRKISGAKEYVKSPDSSFVKFDGEIIQRTTNGVLMVGTCGDMETNFFVEGFPYRSQYDEGADLPGNKMFVALPDGVFTYIAADGSIRSLPKLNYGKPCPQPGDASAVEATAQKLTPYEEQQIANAKYNIEEKKATAAAATKAVQRLSQEIEAEKQATIRAKNAPFRRALIFDQELADKGDPYGLLRMGERYRDGDGVPKDITKAKEYLAKSEKAGDPTAAGELAALNKPPAAETTTPK